MVRLCIKELWKLEKSFTMHSRDFIAFTSDIELRFPHINSCNNGVGVVAQISWSWNFLVEGIWILLAEDTKRYVDVDADVKLKQKWIMCAVRVVSTSIRYGLAAELFRSFEVHGPLIHSFQRRFVLCFPDSVSLFRALLEFDISVTCLLVGDEDTTYTHEGVMLILPAFTHMSLMIVSRALLLFILQRGTSKWISTVVCNSQVDFEGKSSRNLGLSDVAWESSKVLHFSFVFQDVHSLFQDVRSLFGNPVRWHSLVYGYTLPSTYIILCGIVFGVSMVISSLLVDDFFLVSGSTEPHVNQRDSGLTRENFYVTKTSVNEEEEFQVRASHIKLLNLSFGRRGSPSSSSSFQDGIIGSVLKTNWSSSGWYIRLSRRITFSCDGADPWNLFFKKLWCSCVIGTSNKDKEKTFVHALRQHFKAHIQLMGLYIALNGGTLKFL